MKKHFFLLASLCIGLFVQSYGQQIINFPDANFKQRLLELTYQDATGSVVKIDRNGDGEIDRTEASQTISINASVREIASLEGIEYFTNLESLVVFRNNLQSVDVSNNTALKKLNVGGNPILSIDVSQNVNLTQLVTSQTSITALDVTNNPLLEELSTHQANLTAIDVTANVNLKKLSVFKNRLSALDISNNPDLQVLDMSDNQISILDISNNVELVQLYARSNQIENIDVSNNGKLQFLNLGHNAISAIEVDQNPLLSLLSVDSNRLSSIDVTNNSELLYLYLESNQLSTIDLSQANKLAYLNLNNNKFESLDVRPCTLKQFSFSGNIPLKRVYMTGQPFAYTSGGDLQIQLFNNQRNLEFICADQQYLGDIYKLLEQAGSTDVVLSADCTTPSNKIQGQIVYDVDSDGCDAQDPPFIGQVGVTLASPNGSYTAFPNSEGQYTFFVPDGDNNLILPNLANTDYFDFSPPVIFDPGNFFSIPEDLDTINTDYCVQPKGDYNDLEVSIVPISRARPGFDASYKITYRNIGTTTQSATITLSYEEPVLTYASASAVPTLQPGQLTWNIPNLAPMTTQDILITFTLNTPTDSPALNNGDILNYEVNISGLVDETPENNIATLAQTVVNSYDPNDKTCLQGDTISPDQVGTYLHYLIRFENKGTAEAVNVRIKDDIDTTKLDIKTFAPISGSHLFTTTVTQEKTIEFLFSNINLPFDDANNDGYVLFKIKTKSGLQLGDQIGNEAGIYFDFNPPIITNDEIVTIALPTVEDLFIDFPDPNFKSAVLNHNPVIDQNADGNISFEEAKGVSKLVVVGKNISDLTGIEYFKDLKTLRATNNLIAKVDLSENSKLRILEFGRNRLTAIDLSKNTQLIRLKLNKNRLQTIDLSQNTKLKRLHISDNAISNLNLQTNVLLTNVLADRNQISTLDLSANTALEVLGLSRNKIAQIAIQDNINLKRLNISRNQIVKISLSENKKLESVFLGNNKLNSIDLSKNKAIKNLQIQNNRIRALDASFCQLIRVNFSRNPRLVEVSLQNQPLQFSNATLDVKLMRTPNLKTICVDPEYVDAITGLLSTANQPNVSVRSDCGAEDGVFEDYFRISPNPTTGILYLTTLDATISVQTIFIYDRNGNLVRFFPGNTTEMNISTLFPNIYILTVNTNQGAFSTQVIKQD